MAISLYEDVSVNLITCLFFFCCISIRRIIDQGIGLNASNYDQYQSVSSERTDHNGPLFNKASTCLGPLWIFVL